MSAGSRPSCSRGLVDLALHGEARLRRAVAALGAAGRLVGEDARALELVDGDLVRHRLERARVEGGRHAVGAVRAAVEPRAEVHAGDGAVLREAGLDPHQHGVAAAVDVEDLFARERDLHRAARELRQLAGGDLVGEGIELAAEAAADRRRDRRGCAPGAGRGSWRGGGARSAASASRTRVSSLPSAPQCATAACCSIGRCVLPSKKKTSSRTRSASANAASTSPNWSEHGLVHVGPVAVLVDATSRGGQRVLDGHERREAARSRPRSARVARSAVSSSTAATAATASPTIRTLSTQSASSSWETGRMPNFTRGRVLAGDHGVDAGQRRGARRVDARDEGVRMRASAAACRGPCAAG